MVDSGKNANTEILHYQLFFVIFIQVQHLIETIKKPDRDKFIKKKFLKNCERSIFILWKR